MLAKNELFLYVPTFGRAERQITLSGLPKRWLERTVVVCGPGEEKSIGRQFPKLMKLVAPARMHNIAAKRKWIFEKTPYTRIMMLDDDLQFSVRKWNCSAFAGYHTEHPESWAAVVRQNPDFAKLFRVPLDSVDLNNMFVSIELMLNNYKHGGISQRFMNNTFGIEWRLNCKATHAIAFDVPTVRKHCKLGRVQWAEDLDYTLQLMHAGFENAVYCWGATNDPSGFNAPGGESENRTLQTIGQGAHRMEQLHPGIVKAVRRTTPDADEKGHWRIVVQWKKAIEEGKARKAGLL